MTDGELQAIEPEDIPVGGLVNAVPAQPGGGGARRGHPERPRQGHAHAGALRPEEILSQQGEGWDYNGILAFSKICTHVGCPIALYEQRTHHLLCPCHQSTFDLADGVGHLRPGRPALPQLPITVDSEGYLVARSDFEEPVGPSFWERG